MTIDDRARRAANDLSDSTRANLDLAQMLARIEPASRRRTRTQRMTALAIVAAVVLSGAVLLRSQREVHAPAVTPTPAPSATGAAAALEADPPVIRADPANRRAFVIIRLRNTSTRVIYQGGGRAITTGGQLGGDVWDSETGDEAMRLPFAQLEQRLGYSSHRAPTLLPGMRYAWVLELDTDCHAPITPDDNQYFYSPAPFGMGVSFIQGHVGGIEGGPGEIYPVPTPKDPNVLAPPYPGWTLPSWVTSAATAACEGSHAGR